MVDTSSNPLRTHFTPVFSSLGSPDRPSHPQVRPHPTSSDGTFTHLPATEHCTPIWLWCLLNGNRRQRTREHLPSRPSSMGSSCRHRGSALPVALRQTVAPSLSRLHEPHPQRSVRAHTMILGAPPLQMGQQLWRLLSRGPGTACERSYPMSDGQIHPLDTSRVHLPEKPNLCKAMVRSVSVPSRITCVTRTSLRRR
jgi:hypothetical protein